MESAFASVISTQESIQHWGAVLLRTYIFTRTYSDFIRLFTNAYYAESTTSERRLVYFYLLNEVMQRAARLTAPGLNPAEFGIMISTLVIKLVGEYMEENPRKIDKMGYLIKCWLDSKPRCLPEETLTKLKQLHAEMEKNLKSTGGTTGGVDYVDDEDAYIPEKHLMKVTASGSIRMTLSREVDEVFDQLETIEESETNDLFSSKRFEKATETLYRFVKAQYVQNGNAAFQNLHEIIITSKEFKDRVDEIEKEEEACKAIQPSNDSWARVEVTDTCEIDFAEMEKIIQTQNNVETEAEEKQMRQMEVYEKLKKSFEALKEKETAAMRANTLANQEKEEKEEEKIFSYIKRLKQIDTEIRAFQQQKKVALPPPLPPPVPMISMNNHASGFNAASSSSMPQTIPASSNNAAPSSSSFYGSANPNILNNPQLLSQFRSMLNLPSAPNNQLYPPPQLAPNLRGGLPNPMQNVTPNQPGLMMGGNQRMNAAPMMNPNFMNINIPGVNPAAFMAALAANNNNMGNNNLSNLSNFPLPLPMQQQLNHQLPQQQSQPGFNNANSANNNNNSNNNNNNKRER